MLNFNGQNWIKAKFNWVEFWQAMTATGMLIGLIWVLSGLGRSEIWEGKFGKEELCLRNVSHLVSESENVTKIDVGGAYSFNGGTIKNSGSNPIYFNNVTGEATDGIGYELREC